LLLLGLLGPLVALAAPKFDYHVVAEQTDPQQPAAEPAAYLAYDGGYIEAGDPVAGETPPSSSTVRQALLNGLQSHGFKEAGAGVSPAVVLTYHWGLLAPLSHRPKVLGSRLEPNFRARLYLSTTTRTARDVEDQLVSRMKPLTGRVDEEDALNFASDRRYFVVVSAYDFASFARKEKKLLWRTKLSALDTSGNMASVIPTLFQVGAAYFGRNLPRAENGVAALARPAENSTTAATPAPVGQIDSAFLQDVLSEEYFEFSGDVFSKKTGRSTDR
jgi:hypothetical protein